MEQTLFQLIEKDQLLKVLVSLAVGGALGLEREYRHKAAGMRTLTLICLGSTLFTILSVELGYPESADRVASNILTGVGFIGAGVIFKGDYTIDGITTAATIWIASALGIAVGMSHYELAVLSLGLVLLLLIGLKAIENRIGSLYEKRIFTIAYKAESYTPQDITEIFKRYKLKSKQLLHTRKDTLIEDKFEVRGKPAELAAIKTFMLSDRNIQTYSIQSNPL